MQETQQNINQKSAIKEQQHLQAHDNFSKKDCSNVSSELYFELSSQLSATKVIISNSPHKLQPKTYLQVLLEEQLPKNCDLYLKVGEKLLQILFIKIGNNQNQIAKISWQNFQKVIVSTVLKDKQNVESCLNQKKLCNQLGRLFLDQDYNQIEIIEKELVNLLLINEIKNSQLQVNLKTMFNKQKQQQINSDSSQINISFTKTFQKENKHQPQQSQITTNQQQILLQDKTIIPQYVPENQQKQSKFAKFLQKPKYKNDRKRTDNYEYNPKKSNNFKKEKYDNSNKYNKITYQKASKYDRKYACYESNRLSQGNQFSQRQCYSSAVQPYHYYYAYPFTTIQNQYQYSSIQKYYQGQYPQYQQFYPQYQQFYPQYQQFYPQYQVYPAYQPLYSSIQQKQPQNIVIQNDQSSVFIKNQQHDRQQKLKNMQPSQQLSMQQSNDRIDLLNLIQQIASKKKGQQTKQNNNHNYPNQANNPQKSKNKEAKSPNNQKQKHKKQIQQYLLKIKRPRCEINLLCQQFGIEYPTFERKIIERGFLVEGKLQFQSVYLNKRKIKIIAQGFSKNTKQATQLASRKILKIIYQNIQEMWKDFVKVKQKKGISV